MTKQCFLFFLQNNGLSLRIISHLSRLIWKKMSLTFNSKSWKWDGTTKDSKNLLTFAADSLCLKVT